MAVDAFIWFEEPSAGGERPEGETLDDTYSKNKAFEIKDFSFSIENPSTIGFATSFEITKMTDKASPIFFKNCVAGIHYGKVTLVMRKAGGDPNTSGKEVLKYIFGTVFTTGIDWSGPGDEGAEEKIKFVYGTLQIPWFPSIRLDG